MFDSDPNLKFSIDIIVDKRIIGGGEGRNVLFVRVLLMDWCFGENKFCPCWLLVDLRNWACQITRFSGCMIFKSPWKVESSAIGK